MDKKKQYRHELKYRIRSGDYHILRTRFKAVMKPDANTKDGVYRIRSLYFDDIYKTAYFDKANGALNRKKYRIRAYNMDKNFIRLEEKVKDDNVGYKKSAILTYDEYKRILSGERAFLSDERFENTAAEDFFISDSAVRLSPAIIVDYIREPYVMKAGNVRVTFDMKLTASTSSFDIFDENAVYSPVFADDLIVLEVKYDNFLPGIVEELLRGVPLLQESVSKFVMCSDAYNAINYGF